MRWFRERDITQWSHSLPSSLHCDLSVAVRIAAPQFHTDVYEVVVH